MKNSEIKRKHHYVWGHYLKSWCTDRNNIIYISKKNNICSDSVLGLSCEKDFYRINPLNLHDVIIVKELINKSSPILSRLHSNFLNCVLSVQKLIKGSQYIYSDSDFDKVFQANFFEDYLADIENNTVKILQHLRAEDSSSLENKETKLDFCYYLGYQFSRTKKMKEISMKVNDLLKGPEKTILAMKEFTERHWWFLCCFYGT